MLLLLACEANKAPFDDARVEVEVGEAEVTVATVTWGDDSADAMRIEYGPTEDYGKVAHAEEGRALLFGMPERETWHFRLVGEVDGEEFPGADHTVTTGALPLGLPDLELLTPGDPGGYVLTSWLAGHSDGTAVMVLDEEGRIVWYQVPDWGIAMASKVSADGRSVVTLISSHDEIDKAHITRVSVEGELEDDLAVPYAHHDFIEVPFAKYAVIVGEVREIDGEPVLGDQIVEIDEDGGTRVVWSAFDHFAVEENWGFTFMAYSFAADWTHANSLIYDEATDSYLISLYMQRCIVRVARATGEQLWSMCGGDTPGDFAADAKFGPQHSLELTGDGVTFFDNAYESDDQQSRLVHFELGEQSATRTWDWAHPKGYKSIVLGDVETLDDGRMLSSWGEWREIVVSDGEDVDWQVRIVDSASVAQVESFAGF